MPLLPKVVSRRPFARRRITRPSGGWPEPANRMRPALSRTIALMRISRPARAMRATPWLPKRLSSEPSTRRRMTAPRGVPAAVRSVPATSVVPFGPWRTAAAPTPADAPGPSGTWTTPVPFQVGSGVPVGVSRRIVNVAG
jgi:hypothetical protein